MGILSGSRDRFKEAPWYNPDQAVAIGGLGSIGSWLTLFMGRLVNKIYVYDFDTIEEHNLSGQLYGKDDIGNYKQDATKNVASIYNPNTNIIKRGKFEEGSGVTKVSFACFDSMKARRDMFESWRKIDDRELFIDGRLTAEELWVYAVTPDTEEKYDNEYLLSDDEIDELPCSFKSTTHISAMLASYMTTVFTNHSHNKIIEDVREMPFEITYRAAMFMQTNN